MDERLSELIAVGASVAVNCHPCLRHHLAACDRLGIPRDEVRAAAEVGMMVNRGAATQTRKFAAELLGNGAKEKPEDRPVSVVEACGCAG